MTEWRDCTAFFFPPQSESAKDWLHNVLRGHRSLKNEGDRVGSEESCHWAGLPVRFEAIAAEGCMVLVISYYSAEFESNITNSPEAWERFCTSFIATCVELEPLAAVAFGLPSDDISHDIIRYIPAISERDGDWLRAQTYELLYLCRELDFYPQSSSSSAELSEYSLPHGGRVATGPFGRSFPPWQYGPDGPPERDA